MSRGERQNETVAWSPRCAATALTERTPRNERLAEVLDHYMTELESTGVPPDLDRLTAQYPDLAEELRSYADSLQVLHQMTAGLRPTADPQDAISTPAAAKRLGDYEIVREIGRGGMGVVYEAWQLSLNRQVALKVLPFAAMLDERQIVRFRTEAQAAAQLHHPNIVPVHAVGQERGVHYFAMQYIAGQSVEAAIGELRDAAKGLSTPETQNRSRDTSRSTPLTDRDTVAETAFSTRVSTNNRGYCHSVARLIVQAAEALHHAHQLGVIHRDVKPSNLLLDRSGQLWVTDFGLARIQTDAGVTMSGDIVGTVRYMSPEQALGNAALVDARTDVYSLGATLYELLTLKPVHRGESRQEIFRHIESSEPVAPRSANPAVPFDLETIALRALAKSRDERYATAQEFADDLRRFLNGEPAHARRPTLLDRATKWALRHRRSVALASAFMVMLTAVSVGAAVMVLRQQRLTSEALDQARANLTQAENNYELARGAVDQFSSVAGQLAGLPNTEPVRDALLQKTLHYYQQFIALAVKDAALNSDLADAYHKAATIAETMGNRSEALGQCREAIKLFDALASESPTNTKLQSARAVAYNSLGLLLAAEGQSDDARRAYANAIALQRTVAKREPGAAAPERALAESYSNLGLLQGQLGDKENAQRSLKASIALVGDLLANSPADSQLRHDLAIGHNNLSYVERGADWTSSEQSCRSAIEILERLVDDSDSLSYRSDLALCLNNYGAILGHRHEWQAACEAYQKAISLERQLTRQAAAVVAYRRDLAVSLNNLGQARQELGDQPAALVSFNDAEAIVTELVEDYPQQLTFQSLAGAVYNNRAMTLEASQQIEQALPAYESAIERQRTAFERAPQVEEYREFLSKHYFNYGRALRAAGRPGDAAEAALKRRQLWPKHGEHLGQVAVELADAAALVRKDSDSPEKIRKAEALEALSAETLRQAAARGGDLAALRETKSLAFLHDDPLWDKLKTSRDAVAP